MSIKVCERHDNHRATPPDKTCVIGVVSGSLPINVSFIFLDLLLTHSLVASQTTTPRCVVDLEAKEHHAINRPCEDQFALSSRRNSKSNHGRRSRRSVDGKEMLYGCPTTSLWALSTTRYHRPLSVHGSDCLRTTSIIVLTAAATTTAASSNRFNECFSSVTNLPHVALAKDCSSPVIVVSCIRRRRAISGYYYQQ